VQEAFAGTPGIPPGTTTNSFANYLASVPLPAGNRKIYLVGCWLVDPTTKLLTADLIASHDTTTGPITTGVNIIQGHWSSSPFWMCKDTPVPVTAGGWSPSVSFTTGRISKSTGPGASTYYLMFSVKQPPIHPCGQLLNLPAPG